MSKERMAKEAAPHSGMLLAMFAVAFAAACVIALSSAPGAAWAAQGNLAAGDIDAVSTQGYEYPFESAGGDIWVDSRTAGSVSYNAATKTLTLNGVSADMVYIDLEGQALTLNLAGASSVKRVTSYASLTVTGSGSLAGNLNVSKGNLAIKGGSITGEVSVYTEGAAATVSGGKITGFLSTFGPVTMTGGAITYKKMNTYHDPVVTCYGLDMKGGTITSKNADRGISVHGKDGKLGNLTQTGGAISIQGTTYAGVTVGGGNLVLKKGTLAVTGTHGDAIDVYSSEYRSKKYGGKVQIKGGTLKATVVTPKTYSAISATSMTNTYASMKAISGQLAAGAKFKASGNEYVVTKSSYVRLAKYNAKAKKAKIGDVKYGGHTYHVAEIGAGAFNTKAGKKVTSIAVNSSYLTKIGAKAFANTKALKSLTFKYTGWYKTNYTSDDKKIKSVKVRSGYSIAKNAFSKCGKSGGKGLTVSLGKYGTWRKEVGPYKKLLTTHGMPKSAKLKTY